MKETGRSTTTQRGDHAVVRTRRVAERAGQPARGPQGRHVHALLARGSLALDELFPGLLSEILARGAPVCDGADPAEGTSASAAIYSRGKAARKTPCHFPAEPGATGTPGPAAGVGITSTGKLIRAALPKGSVVRRRLADQRVTGQLASAAP